MDSKEKEQLAIELMKDIRALKQLQISDIYTADYQLAMGLITLGYRRVKVDNEQRKSERD